MEYPNNQCCSLTNIVNTVVNKKAFQSNANRPLMVVNKIEHVLGGSCIVTPKLNKLEHVWGRFL